MKEKVTDFIKAVIGKLTYIIPKQKNLHIYFPTHDKKKFSGNIKTLILYANKNYPEIKSVLITPNKKVAEAAKESGIRVVTNNFLVLWFRLRAELIFVDNSAGMYGYGRYRFVQLWHGVGFKCVGMNWVKKDKSLKKRIKKYKGIYSRCILVAATSQSNVEVQNKSFLTDKAAITGYPRNDVFFNGSGFVEELKNKYNLKGFRKVITYAPTFRDNETHPPFTEDFWEKLNRLLADKNELFVVKKHPWDKFLNIPENLSNIRDLTKIVADPQELLVVTDMLITDYSSISTDFVITNRPVVIYAYDLEDYISSCRNMAYDLEAILPKPFIRTQEELLGILEDNSWFEHSGIKESYEKFRNTFHYYLDGNSSKRVMEEIKKLNNNKKIK